MDLYLYFDGSCEPINPGGTATGAWVLKEGSGTGPVLGAGSKVVARGGPRATNNFAEWCALGLGLRYILDHPVEPDGTTPHLFIFGDSQLVINQLNGVWKTKKKHLIPLRDRCIEYLDRIGITWVATWIPRERNSEADGLSRSAG